MSEFRAEDYLERIMSGVAALELKTPEEDFIKNYLEKADDEKPYCMVQAFEAFVNCKEDDEKEYLSYTQAAFLKESYVRYGKYGLETLTEEFLQVSEAKDFAGLVEALNAYWFSFENYLKTEMLYDDIYFFLVEDNYPKGYTVDEKQFGNVENVDVHLKQIEEEVEHNYSWYRSRWYSWAE